jgi:acyl-CoA synthetase (NDP forming)
MDRMTGAIVQPMASDGVEMMIGVTHDPAFGPVIAAGAGGTLVELLDRRILPPPPTTFPLSP